MASENQQSFAQALAVLNHGIQLPNATPEQNARASALDLMSRATSIHQAIQTLKLPYTYDIIRTTPEKRKNRETIASLCIEMLEAVRDEIAEAGVIQWLRSRGLTTQEVGVILEAHRERAV